jgi:hypothetical protein
MENENWYRQLIALALMSGTRAAVDFITNPDSRQDATRQLRTSLAEIDYDAVAQGITRLIEGVADTSKATLADKIDTLRDRGVGAVDDAKSQAEKRLGKKKSNNGLWLFVLAFGGAVTYFVVDKKRRDALLDRLTGASGPIQQAVPNIYQQASSAAQAAASKVPDGIKKQAPAATDDIKKAADTTSEN